MAVTTFFESFSLGFPNPTLGPGQSFPDVVALANGGYAVGSDAFGQSDLEIFKADGGKAGVAGTLGGQRAAVDQLTNGNIVVAFQDADSVIFRIVNGIGGPVVSNVDTGVPSSAADVAALRNGEQNFVLVYQRDFGGGDFDVRMEIIAPDGTTVVPAKSLDISTAADVEPVVCALDDGGFAIAWVRQIGADTQLWTAVYNANGSERRGPAAADDVGSINRAPAISAVNGGFAVAYEDDTTGTGDIALQVFNSAGVFQRVANISNPEANTGGSNDERPAIARMSNGWLGVAWESNGFPDTDILFVLVDPATGLRVPPVTNIKGGEQIEDDVGSPAVAFLTDDRRVVFQTNLTDEDVDGEVFFDRRVSTSDGAGDVVTGDSIRDRMEGNGGDDTLNGLGNADILNGGDGADILNGGDGDDILDGGADNDTYNGGAGVDTANFRASAVPVTVNMTIAGPQNTGNGLDTFSSIENVIGSPFADKITGNNLKNSFFGLDGADTLRGGSGDDYLDGGNGGDLIVGDAGRDTMLGGEDADRLYGGSSDDSLFGGAGADLLAGGPGIDRLDGGADPDRLYADGTADTFVFKDGGGDRVFRFVSGLHMLEIHAGSFGGTAGIFDFFSGSTPVALGATQALLYDTDDGKLFFDADGDGAGGRVHVLTLILAPTLGSGDITFL